MRMESVLPFSLCVALDLFIVIYLFRVEILRSDRWIIFFRPPLSTSARAACPDVATCKQEAVRSVDLIGLGKKRHLCFHLKATPSKLFLLLIGGHELFLVIVHLISAWVWRLVRLMLSEHRPVSWTACFAKKFTTALHHLAFSSLCCFPSQLFMHYCTCTMVGTRQCQSESRLSTRLVSPPFPQSRERGKGFSMSHSEQNKRNLMTEPYTRKSNSCKTRREKAALGYILFYFRARNFVCMFHIL
jgi:hypothetical protein